MKSCRWSGGCRAAARTAPPLPPQALSRFAISTIPQFFSEAVYHTILAKKFHDRASGFATKGDRALREESLSAPLSGAHKLLQSIISSQMIPHAHGRRLRKQALTVRPLAAYSQSQIRDREHF